MKKPNSQQQAIIDCSGRNIIVSASAGTGKTTTLTNKLLNYLKQGGDISEYLIVSFTETAASELKERISQQLKSSLADADEKQKEHYRQQIAKVPLANISTIHSFCLDVIRRYGYVRDIDPAIAGKLADDGKLQELQDKAMKIALEPLRHNETIYRYCDQSYDTDNISKAIRMIDSFIGNLEDYPQWKEMVLARYALATDNDFSWYQDDADDLLKKLEEAAYDRQSAFQAIGSDKAKAELTGFMVTFDEYTNKVAKAISRHDLTAVSELSGSLGKFPTFHHARNADEEICEMHAEAKKRYDDALKKLCQKKNIVLCIQNTASTIEELLNMAEKYRQEFDRLKEAENVIGYEDMLKMAKEILQADHGRIAGIYQERFKMIMVDEYQDTNQNQENIISCIARNDNVLRVGDIKQSIFKFQNAKPEMMKDLIAKAADTGDAVLPLQYNYRSHCSIIRFSNYLFKQLMNLEEENYKEADDLLIPADNLRKSGEKIQLVTVPYEDLKAKDKARFISEYIANKICELHKKKGLKWSSFAVLVRSNRYKIALKKAFIAHNIPTYTTAKTGFFNDPAVSAVIALLKLVLTDSKLNALNVLSSPLFAMSYQQIAEQSQLLDLNNDSELSRLVNTLRQHYQEGSYPSRLLDEIYAYHDFYMEKTSSFERSNLDSLYKLVQDQEAEDSSLSSLVEFLSAYQRVDKEEASSFTNKDDVVQIMTIHGSKGLEFEYVFLADFFFRADNRSSLVALNEKSGMAVDYVSLPYKVRYRNPYKEQISLHNKIEDFEEELRLLYVAVTRAIKGLYVVNAAPFNCDIPFTSTELLKQGMMTWIKAALRNCPAEIAALYEEIYIENMDKLPEYTAPEIAKAVFVKEKYTADFELLETGSLSPSKLEDRNITSLNFEMGSGSLRGTLMHKAVELLGIRDVTLDEIKALDLGLSADDERKILNFYKHPFTASLHDKENYHEYPFIRRKDDSISSGIIDLLSVAEEVLIIDFKSDLHTSAEKLISRYAVQLKDYRSVIEKQYPDKKIRTLIYSFDLNDYIEVN